MKTCEEFTLLSSLVLDGEASPKEEAELREHLASCPGCRTYFEDIQRIHEASVPEDVVLPEGFALQVMDQVRKTSQDQPHGTKKTVPFPHWRRWAAAAACCALVLLSLWAVQHAGGVRKNVVMMDQAARSSAAPQDMNKAPASGPEANAGGEGGDAPTYDKEAPPPMPEEYVDTAISAAKEGAAQGQYQPIVVPQSDPESGSPMLSSPPAGMTNLENTDSGDLPEAKQDAKREEAAEDAPQPAPDTPAGDADAPSRDGAEVMPLILPAEEPEPAEEMPEPAASEPEEPATSEMEEAEEPVEAIAPVEILGVPEPGILTAFGSAARAWVENTLGLEWIAGGSYPLSAEQYSDLLRTLEEAGEAYRIEPGEGYCLMAE